MGDGHDGDVDVLLCLLVAQIARHQQNADRNDADWVSVSALEALCQRVGHLGAAAIERGWHVSASERGVLDLRESPNGPQVRLDPSVASAVGLDVEHHRPAEGWLRELIRRVRGE